MTRTRCIRPCNLLWSNNAECDRSCHPHADIPLTTYTLASMGDHQPYVTIRSRQSVGAFGARNSEPAVSASYIFPPTSSYNFGPFYNARSAANVTMKPPTATHDISRTRFHVKHIDQFAKRLEDVRLDQSYHRFFIRNTYYLVRHASIPKQRPLLSTLPKCSSPPPPLDI